MDKKAQKSNNMVLLIAVIAIGYVLIFGVPELGGPAAEPPTGGTTAACPIEDSSVTLQMRDVELKGTSVLDNVFVLTDDRGATTVGAAANYAANKDIQAMYGENSTSYYTKVATFNTDCQGELTQTEYLAKADTTLTTYVENDNGENVDTVAQTIGADDVVEVLVTMKTSAREYFGNPDSDCQNIAVVEYDKTYFRAIEGDDPAPVPGSFTFTNATYDGSDAMYVPKLGSGEKDEFTLSLESTSNDPVAGIAMPIITFLDCDIDKNEDDLSIIEGVEDEDDNSISLGSVTDTIEVQ